MKNFIHNLFPEHVQDAAYSTVLLALWVLAGLAVGIILFRVLCFVVKKRDPAFSETLSRRLKGAAYFFMMGLFYHAALSLVKMPQPERFYFAKIGFIVFVAAIGWLLIKFSHAIRDRLYRKYDIDQANNLRQRKARTQIQFIHRLTCVIISIIGLSIILMSFDSVRQIGTSILASAGVAGLIIGFAAQRSIANLLAGLQIAFTQPIRIDDVVIVEGEWGRIEEINMTYVVVSIWDQRRLVLPISYFIEKPFQNWTRVSADLLGSVFIYTDYTLPVDALRKELTRILENEGAALWDKRVNVVQVTDTTERTMVIRALVSAGDSSQAWELRCLVREKLVRFIQENYPDALPKIRADKALPGTDIAEG